MIIAVAVAVGSSRPFMISPSFSSESILDRLRSSNTCVFFVVLSFAGEVTSHWIEVTSAPDGMVVTKPVANVLSYH